SWIQQKVLDDALVAPQNRLKIGKCNQRLSPTLKSNEPTIQVALDALKLTPFYNTFEVSADVLEIYMQEFWVTVTKHHFSLRFKMNSKSHTVNVDNFRDMLKILPKLPGQKFEDPPFEKEILSFIRDLGHTGEIKVLSDINVNHLHQPRRSFAAIINKCLSGKTTTLDNLVYQVENKNSKNNNDMYYPRFTKVIIDYFMAKDKEIPRRNKMFWHYAKDDLMFITIRVISKHQDTQVYDAILPQHLTNQDMLESKAYKTYCAYDTGEKTPKPKYTKKKADLNHLPRLSLLKLLKEKESRLQLRDGSGADEGTGVLTGVPDVPSYDSEAEQISWKSSDKEDDDEVNMGNDNDDDADNQDDVSQEYDEQDDDDQEHDGQEDEEQDDVNEQTDSNNNGDDFVHPKLSTYVEEDKEEVDSDLRVHTPSNYESTDDEESDKEIQGANFEGEEMDEEDTNEEDKANELYRDVNVNLEGRDTEMIDAPRTIVQTTQVIEDTHVIVTPVNHEAQQQSSSMSSGFISNMLNPSLDTGIDFIFNLNTESTSLIDVLLTTIAEPPLLSTTTLPLTPTPLITHLQQTLIPTPATAPSSSLQDLPNFGSLFWFDHKLKTLENDFSELKQTNQFTTADSLIPCIIDAYLANKMHEAVKIVKTVNEQLEAEVLTRSSNESKTSHAVAANLSELELKKILIDNMESNKSIHKSDEQKNLYKALVDAYESDKLILDTYCNTPNLGRSGIRVRGVLLHDQ
ncbi:hypothetical protein Tco_1332519, partial [Tanacetum coccineum]